MNSLTKNSHTDGMMASPFSFVSLLLGRGSKKENLRTRTISKIEKGESLAERTYTIISIDHASANSNLPDYRIAVRSDGVVIFHGRQNTAVIGIHTYLISQETISALRNIFVDEGFAEIDKHVSSLNVPAVFTSYREDFNSYIISRLDYCDQPKKLIAIREKAEELLKVDALVNNIQMTDITNFSHEYQL